MAEQSYPFDQAGAAGTGGQANVLEGEWQRMGRAFLASGVIIGHPDSGGLLAVSANGAAMQVTVATGLAWVEGFLYRNDTALAQVIGAADATNPRIDTVVVRLDRAANNARVFVKQGVAAASPAAPALTQTDVLWELPLANVTVPAAAGVIVAGNVADRRALTRNLGRAGGDLTGRLDVNLGRLPDVLNAEALLGREFVGSSDVNTTFLQRVMRRITGGASGNPGMVARIERVTDATVQSALAFHHDHLAVEGAPFRVQNGPRLTGVLRTDRAGGAPHVHYSGSGGLFLDNGITDVNVTPLDYPLGFSMVGIGGQAGWPEAFGIVTTFRGNNYVRQEFTPASSGGGGAFNNGGAGNRYQRLGIAENGGAGSDGWTNWQEAMSYGRLRHTEVSAAETTTSSNYTDLATVGPVVDLLTPASGRLLVSCAYHSTAGGTSDVSSMSTRITRLSDGVELLGATDDQAATAFGGSGSKFTSAGWERVVSGLAPGINVRVQARYRSVSTATAGFARRQVRVLPLPTA